MVQKFVSILLSLPMPKILGTKFLLYRVYMSETFKGFARLDVGYSATAFCWHI